MPPWKAKNGVQETEPLHHGKPLREMEQVSHCSREEAKFPSVNLIASF
jgi:hypothetical protein